MGSLVEKSLAKNYFQEEIKRKQIEVFKDFLAVRVVSYCDLIEKVMDNILHNAIKFALPNSRIVLKYTQNEEKYFFSVSNIHDMNYSTEDKISILKPFT